MRIALYHTWIYGKGGGERLVLELLKRSRHDITLFTSSYNKETTYPEFRKFKIRKLRGVPVVGELIRGASYSLLAAASKLPMKDFDALVVSTGGIAEMIALKNNSKPVVAYVHTPLRAVHDPGIYREKAKTKSRLSMMVYDKSIALYKKLEKKAWKKISFALCNSENTRSRLTRAGLIPRSRTKVIHPGADTSSFSPGKYEKYFLYPSRFSYHKRQDLAVKAFIEYKKRNPRSKFRLVLAGGVNPENKNFFEKVKSMSKRNDITVKADVSAKEWKSLYSNCYAVLFCAINEDWGIVPIEAGASKKPVISVDEGGPRESIIRGKSGLLVKATPKAIAVAMQKLAKKPALARKMGQVGFRHSKKFTWDSFVKGFDSEMDRIKTKNF